MGRWMLATKRVVSLGLVILLALLTSLRGAAAGNEDNERYLSIRMDYGEGFPYDVEGLGVIIVAGTEDTEVIWHGTVGANGTATGPTIAWLRAQRAVEAGSTVELRPLWAAFDFPCDPHRCMPIGPEILSPNGFSEVKLPPPGIVKSPLIQLRDLDGKPVRGPMRIAIVPHREDSEGLPRIQHVYTVRDSEARVPRLEGLHWYRAIALSFSPDFGHAILPIGRTFKTEVILMKIPPPSLIVNLDLPDSRFGVPHRSVRVTSTGGRFDRMYETDANSRIELGVPRPLDGRHLPAALRFSVLRRDALNDTETEWFAVMPGGWSAIPEFAKLELGTRPLAQPGLGTGRTPHDRARLRARGTRLPLDLVRSRARGTVVDPHGVPIAAARVTTDTTFGPVETRTREDGTFSIQSSEAIGLQLRIEAGSAYEPVDIIASEGDGPMWVEIPARQTLRGSVLLPDGVDLARLHVAFCASDGTVRSTRLSEGGTFRFAPPDGCGVLDLFVSGCDRPATSSLSIDVPAGETTDVGVLDLRDRVRQTDIFVAAPDGRPLPRAWILDPEGEGRVVAMTRRDGTASFLRPTVGPPYIVAKAGYDFRELDPEPVQEIVLSRAIEIEARVTGDGTGTDRRALRVEVAAIDPRPLPGPWLARLIDHRDARVTSGRAVIRVPRAGRYRTSVHGYSKLLVEAEIAVKSATAARQTIELDLPPR